MENNQLVVNESFVAKVSKFLETHLVIYQFMRFACIGFLNTGLSFLVQNSISKYFGVSYGWKLGAIQGIAFVCAVLQSYPWNRTWTFGSETGVTMWRNVVRLLSVGLLGFAAVVFIYVASALSAPFWSYVIFLAVFLIVEKLLWSHFGFHMSDWDHVGHSFAVFFTVTLIGLGINSTLSSVVSTHLHLTKIVDLDKNIAVAIATGASLIWNFTGYKIVVFKK